MGQQLRKRLKRVRRDRRYKRLRERINQAIKK
jgi:UDP:flavonoid glycosyltransferase YjiC (YdhE family)